MGDDQFQIVFVRAQNVGGFFGHEAVAGAVETVAAHAQFAVELAGDGIHIRVFGHGLVECGVEHGHIRQAFEDVLRGADAQQVGRVVQRCQRNAFFDGCHHAVVNQHGFAVFFAAAHHAVADGTDLAIQAHGFQFFQHCAHCAGVVRRCAQIDTFFLAVHFKCDVGICQVQFFAQAAQQHIAVFAVQNRSFQRRRTAV